MKKFVLIGCLLFIGCGNPSMNLQRSIARDGGDSGITIYLDRVDEIEVPDRIETLNTIISEIEKILDDQVVGDLTVVFFKDTVTKIVPEGFESIFNHLIDYLRGFEMPSDQIPENIVRKIKSALQGMRVGIVEYKIEDRNQ